MDDGDCVPYFVELAPGRFRPNPALSSFDGRADVQIKVLKAVNAITIAGHRVKFTNGTITLQPGNIPLIATPQDDGDELRQIAVIVDDQNCVRTWRGCHTRSF